MPTHRFTGAAVRGARSQKKVHEGREPPRKGNRNRAVTVGPLEKAPGGAVARHGESPRRERESCGETPGGEAPPEMVAPPAVREEP